MQIYEQFVADVIYGCRDVWIFGKVGRKGPARHRKKILITTTHELGKKRKNSVFENDRFGGLPSESRTGPAFGWLTTYECPALIRK